ncbi:MAG: hypothetical protein KF802_01340 [Bdellovibrionaceae bacterium]|nr:hypothetical protein [Pseudobdellovibrionaceae bacterium]MBX3035027.1 hypothetical protein [Pseudobdellovibrionaceae bacterium]
MNWMKSLRALSITLASATLVLSPVAEGAKAQDQRREQMKNFLRASGFDNPKNTLTVAEFHRRFRAWYPEAMRAKFDEWAAMHRLEKMPQVSVSTFKDADGREQTRLHFTHQNGQSYTLTSGQTKEGEGYVQVGSVRMTAADYHNPDAFAKKLFSKDEYFKKMLRKTQPVNPLKASIVLTAREYANMSPEKRALYFLQLRYLMDLSAQVLEGQREAYLEETTASFRWSPAFEVIARWVVGESAFCAPPKPVPRPKSGAAKKGGKETIPAPLDTCVVAGYISKYDERGGSCGGDAAGKQDWAQQVSRQFVETFPNAQKTGKTEVCGSGGYPCNPLVYGFQGGGSPYCVGRQDIKYATKTCNNMSPLKSENDVANAKRIVESWVKAQGKNVKLRFNDKGELHEEDYKLIEKELMGLNNFIDSAVAACDSDRGAKIQKKREDQQSACEEIRKRKMALLRFMPKQVEGVAAVNCVATIPGSMPGPGGDCMCEGNVPPTPGEKAAMSCPPVVIPAPPPPPPAVVAEETNWTPWIIGGVVVAGIVACVIWCFGDDKKVNTPVYVPPQPPPGNNPDPVPQDPCVVNPTADTCQPPVPPPPPPPPPAPVIDETGSGQAPANSGGVR